MMNNVIEKKNSLTPEMIGNSDVFRENLRRNMQAALRSHNILRDVKLEVEYSPKSDVTAYTDGNLVHINAGNCWYTATSEGKKENAYPYVKKVYGTMFHELGHMFYTSFQDAQITMRGLVNGIIDTGDIPLSSEMEASKKSLSDAMRDRSCGVMSDEVKSSIQSFTVKFWKELHNCMEDGRIERLLLTQDSQFAGLCEGLITLRNQHYIMLSKEIPQGKKLSLVQFLNMILLYAKYRTIKGYSGGFDVLDRCIPYVDDFYNSRDAKHASWITTYIVLEAYAEFIEPYLVKMQSSPGKNGESEENDSPEQSEDNEMSGADSQKPDSENNESNKTDSGKSDSNESDQSDPSQGQSSEGAGESQGEKGDGNEENGSGSSNGSGTERSEKESAESDLKKTLEDANDALAKAGENTSEIPNDSSGSWKNGTGESSSEKKDQGSDSEDLSKAAFDKMARDIAKELVSEDIQKKAHDETAELGRQAAVDAGICGGSNKRLPGDGIKCVNVRPMKNADRIIQSVRRESGSWINRAAREIQRHYETDQYTGVSKHRYAGKKFLAGNVVRNDYRYFESRSVKREMPSLAAALCIDESGSMECTGRTEFARKAAICLYDLIDAVDHTDLMILGHTTDSEHVILYPYLEFGKKPKNIERRLTAIGKGGNGGNFDSVPFRVCAEKLLRNPAEIKVLIMITDGLPNGGSAGRELLCEAVQEYKRKGVEIITASIGSDSERIKELYPGCRFLDIRDVGQLPRKMVTVIKRRM